MAEVGAVQKSRNRLPEPWVGGESRISYSYCGCCQVLTGNIQHKAVIELFGLEETLIIWFQPSVMGRDTLSPPVGLSRFGSPYTKMQKG